MDKRTVLPPPGHGHQPRIATEDKPKTKQVSDYLVELCACIFFFLCMAALGVVGTYKLIMMMLQ